ncbi:hypothetical protein Atep_20650 [Allochromatium tepidum]|uniref:PASTA domain-containing protein n=1 Tax=Allochromatium tepidum TaxID=553982 RepID=A0ABM7QN13_9GAMM|nr:hypothetical protein Atep_20650 [Allochromatium tepidum]
MNPRLKAIACCIAMSSLLLSACASNPRSTAESMPSSGPAPIDTTYLPRLILPGATTAEVRSLALGAARSRGWTVRHADLTDERLVVERPADSVPGVAAAPGSTLEVTTLLKNYGGGIEVATLAEVVTPAYAGRPAERIDYTDQFRDPLMQSLDSLRERWIRDRERLARATPPVGGWRDAWEDSNTPPTSQPVQAADDSPRAAQAVPPAPAAPTYTPPPSAPPRTDPSVGPRAVSTPSQSDSGIPRPTYTRRPTTPEPRYSAPGAAPVVDAGLNPNRQPPREPAPVYDTSVVAQDNMMSLPRPDPVIPTAGGVGARVLWSANAEQYARQRGCQVSGSGSQLIESRQDGEVYKVPCQGSDSFLIRCQDGLCQGLL